jgi:sugar (pentulose or hexulose) kinase
MIATPVIAIFDVGKTNKKLLLFDEAYQLVLEKTVQHQETTDEDGFACEDIHMLTSWIKNSFQKILTDTRFHIKAVNFSAYGASFVHINENGQPGLLLYNYLKPFPPELQHRFYNSYGGEQEFSKRTASPVLGNLNSGMQLYWLKHRHPQAYENIRYSLHLPQYLSFILGAVPLSDLTSIGCHTNLWDFSKHAYHEWVFAEGIDKKLAPVVPGNTIVNKGRSEIDFPIGVGLHDSSAALIPYLESFHEPFVLLSTGTWCISLNPFNKDPLTEDELRADCLCYLSFKGDPVKASRLFAGNEHEQWIKKLSDYYHKDPAFFHTIKYRSELVGSDHQGGESINTGFDRYGSYEEAYHRIMQKIMFQQKASTDLVLKDQNVKRIFVDGGFSKNEVYMNLLAGSYPNMEVFAASVAQSTGMGAAIAIHREWNSRDLPSDIIQLKYYSAKQQVSM